MGKSSVVSVKILGDAKNLKAALADSEQGVQAFATKAGGAMVAVGAAIAAASLAVGGALLKIGTDFQGMEATIIRGTGASGAALEDLLESTKDVMAEVPQSGAVVAAAIADVNTFFGLTGDQLEDTTKLFLDFARVGDVEVAKSMKNVRGMMAQFNIPLAETDDLLGDLVRISQATGEGMEPLLTNLQTMGPTFQQMGFSLEESAAMLGQFSRAGVEGTKVSSGLIRFMGEMAESGEDPRQAFEDLVEAIGSATTETDALAIATEAFGTRSAGMLSSAIRSGAIDVDNFSGLLGDGTGVVDTQAEAIMGLGDRWGILKNKVFIALQPIATKLFKKIEEFVIKITPKVQELAERFEEWLNSKQFEDFKDAAADAFKAVGEAIEFVAGTFGKWVKDNPKTFLAGLATVIGVVLVAAVWALVAAVAALFTPVTLIVAGIALLAAGAVWAYQNVDVFREAVDNWVDSAVLMWEGLKDIWNWFANFDLGAVWASLSEAVVTAFDDTINYVADLTTRITDALASGLWRFVDWGADVTTKITDGIGDIAGKIKNKIMGLGGSIFAIGVKMTQWGKDLGTALINGLIEMWNRADLVIPGFTVPSWIPGVGGSSFGEVDLIPDVSYLAAGGLVTGPTLAMIGEGGQSELVLPLDRAGEFLGGGSTFNITVNMPAGADGQDVLEAIQRETRWRGTTAFPVRTDRRS
jgi:TP901 family phage tail tape measure protein